MRTFAAILLTVTATAVYAQAPPPALQAQAGAQGTVRCAPVQPPLQGQGKEERSQQTIGQSREPLSDRLAQSEGTMCPPSNVDPEINKGAPDIGKMPVLPPPGSPGGDPTVRPK
jgi:hypothetical protein